MARIVRALVAAALMVACGCAPPAPARVTPRVCEPARLAECEQRIAAATPERSLVDAYVGARAEVDPADAWVALHRGLGRGRGAVVIIEAGAIDRKGLDKEQVVDVPALPKPGAIPARALMLAMAGAAGATHVFHAHGDRIDELFPGDPLSPLVAGIEPAVATRGGVARIGREIALEKHVRAALEAAGNGSYVEAAHEADAIVRALRDGGDATALRARYALSLLGQAGLVLDAPEEAPLDRPPLPAVEPDETPYAAYLAVVTAKDPRKAWPARAERVLSGVAADRREDVASLFVQPKGCGAGRAPPMEGARDLVFASRLGASLSMDPAPRPGELGLTEWLSRYETMLALAQRTHTVWSLLPALLAQRGDATGLGLSSTPAYQTVTGLGRAHIQGVSALATAESARFRAISQVALALSPGLRADPALERAMAGLMEASVKGKLAAATQPDAILGAALAGAIAGLAYPPGLQETHFGALQGALTAKLRGDLLQRAGWGVAAIYAIDAIYRLLADAGPDLDFSARQIARALADRDLPHPALAALASAGARYGALAAGRRLDPGARRIPADRAAAREALREAIAGLGARGEAPSSVLDDITELTDELLATLSAAALGAGAKKAAARASTKTTCGATPAIAMDAATRRALARLGDVRLRILKHPRYAKGDGTWVRRARALVTVLSDAMDLAIASDTQKPPVFLVSAEDAEAAWRGALGDDAPRGAADAIAAGHMVARSFASSRSTDAFVKQSGRDVRRLASGLFALFGGDAIGPRAGAALMDAIARAPAGGSDDPASALIAYASLLYADGRPDQADLCLLGVMVVTSLTRKPPPAEAVALAEKHRSRVGWALRFTREIKASTTPDPAVYAEGLRGATDDACQVADADATLAVAEAVRDFAAGKRREARQALDRALDHADERGLGVPRMAYRYEEKTRTKVFSADVEVSYGAGLLLSGQTFQLGVGLRSGGDPEGSLSASLVSPASPRAAEDAARYYVYAAALAAVYHLLEHDSEHAVAAARRAIATLSSGVKLGPRRVLRDRPAAFGEDAREILIVAAQLAAEAGMPFLAGDLWTVVRQGFTETLDDKAVATMLDRMPIGLAGLPELAKVIEHARRSLKVLAEPMACTDARVELGAYEEAACDGYPLALSLRIADALKKLPRLKRNPETSARCGHWKALDAFLSSAGTGTYDPDAFTRAVEALTAHGSHHDAAVLLARHKRAGHCSPAIVAAARTLGRSRQLGPSLRADLLSQALNCAAAAGGAEVEADLLALDDETQRLPDASRNLTLVFSIADLAARSDRWELVARLVDRPDFVTRWLSVHPNASAAALVLDHAAATLRGREVDLTRGKATYKLVCETFPATERAEPCRDLAALRAPGPLAERQKLAKEAVRRLLATAAAPAPAKKGR